MTTGLELIKPFNALQAQEGQRSIKRWSQVGMGQVGPAPHALAFRDGPTATIGLCEWHGDIIPDLHNLRNQRRDRSTAMPAASYDPALLTALLERDNLENRARLKEHFRKHRDLFTPRFSTTLPQERIDALAKLQSVADGHFISVLDFERNPLNIFAGTLPFDSTSRSVSASP